VSWVLVAIGGSAALGAGASYLGSKKQAKGAERAQDINLDMFQRVMAQQQPFVSSGYGAMGRLNTLLGLNPRPGYVPPGSAQPPAFRPTPGGGVEPIMQVGTPQASGNARLNELLALRAQNGDQQALALLKALRG
jgi:hypothetical protein